MAVDMGNPPLNSSMASFTINVTDVNDNSPVFTPSAFIAHVSEGAALGTSVVRVNASEKDQVGEVQLCYRIVSGDPESHFEIDNKTVSLSISNGLNVKLCVMTAGKRTKLGFYSGAFAKRTRMLG